MKTIIIITIMLMASTCFGDQAQENLQYKLEQKYLAKVIRALEGEQKALTTKIMYYKKLKRRQQNDKASGKAWELRVYDLPTPK